MIEAEVNTVETENEPTPKPQGKLQRIVEGFLQLFGVEDFISYAQVMHNFFFVVAIVFVGVLEIFNTHLAVRLNRSINKKQDVIKELRWEYMNVKTEMNLKSKQSELQKIVEPYGLKSLQEPPKKIEINKDALD
ncbi:MAG: FtsL-like putative cell division protein [Chitinophagales bacterium]